MIQLEIVTRNNLKKTNKKGNNLKKEYESNLLQLIPSDTCFYNLA